MLSDDFWGLDESRWEILGKVSSEEHAGGWLKMRAGIGSDPPHDLSYAAITGKHKNVLLLSGDKAKAYVRLRCRITAPNPLNDEVVVEVGFKPEGEWDTYRGDGYYISYDPDLRSELTNPDEYYVVAKAAASSINAEDALWQQPASDKVAVLEIAVALDGTSCTVQGWSAGGYSPVELTIPASSEPLMGELVPGIGIYRLSSGYGDIHVDFLEFETPRYGEDQTALSR